MADGQPPTMAGVLSEFIPPPAGGRRCAIQCRDVRGWPAATPRVTVEAAALYVDQGRVATSGLASAGLDLCLHLIERDHGSAVAMNAARAALMPIIRPGG